MDRVTQIWQQCDEEVCYRWKSLTPGQRLDYGRLLADVRQTRKGSYGKKCQKGKIKEQTRDESAKDLVRMINECVLLELELIEYGRDRDAITGEVFGREYAKQATAAQRVPREVRALLYASNWDVDMKDAQRRIVYDWLNTQGKLSEFPIFAESVEKREKIRKKIATEHNCMLDGAKKLMIKPWFSAGDYSADAAYRSWCKMVCSIPSEQIWGWYAKYHTESQQIRQLLLNANPKFRERAKTRRVFREYDREGEEAQYENNEGSATALLLQTWEWELLQEIIRALKNAGFHVNASIHDGCLVSSTHGCPDAKSISDKVRSSVKFMQLQIFEVEIKPFERVPELPLPQKWTGFDRAEMSEWEEFIGDPLGGTGSQRFCAEYTHVRKGSVAHDASDTTVADLNDTKNPASELYTVVELQCRPSDSSLTLISPPIAVAFPTLLPKPVRAYRLYVKTGGVVGWRQCSLDMTSGLLLGLDSRRQLEHSEIVALTRIMTTFQENSDIAEAFTAIDACKNLETVVPDKVGLLTESEVENPIFIYGNDWQPPFDVSGDRSTNVSTANPGAGKTFQAKQAIKKLPDDAHVLWIAPSVSLHKQLDRELADLGFIGYRKSSGAPLTPDEVQSIRRLHITPESLPKLLNKTTSDLEAMFVGTKYTYVVIDEFSTVLQIMLVSPTCKRDRKFRLDLFFRFIRNVPHVIILDADLSDFDLGKITQVRSDTANVYCPKDMTSPWTDFELPSVRELIQQAAYDIDMDKTIFVSSDTKRHGCHTIASILRSTLPERDRDRIIVVDAESKDKDLGAIVLHMQSENERGRPILALVVSPTVVTGVDISTPLFDAVYTLLSGSTLSPFGAYQQMCRVRPKAMRGNHIRYVVVEQNAAKSKDARTLASHREKVVDQLQRGKAWTGGAQPALSAHQLDQCSSFGKLDVNKIPYFDDKLYQDFKSNIGKEGRFRDIFRAICTHRGDAWFVCTAKSHRSVLRCATHSARSKFSARVVTSTRAEDMHANTIKERMAHAMCVAPSNLLQEWCSTLTTIDEFENKWARLRFALVNKSNTPRWNFDSIRPDVQFTCFKRLQEVLERVLDTDLSLCASTFSIVAGQRLTDPPYNVDEVDLALLKDIRRDANALGNKGRCRKEKKECLLELKTYMDLYQRLVDAVYPYVPQSGGTKRGLLQKSSKRIRSGREKNKYMYLYKWDKTIIRTAAENAIAAGRIEKSDVSPRFIPTLSEAESELGSARTGAAVKRASKKQRVH